MEDVVVGATPREVVLRHDKLSLFRYRSENRRHPAPVLLVPALISRSYILDLYPGGSFVEFLVDHGWDVYLADWGIAGDEDAHRDLEYYVANLLPRCVERVRERSASEALTLLGYCMGGTMVAAYAALEHLGPPNNLITLAAPIDFTHGGILAKCCAPQAFDVDRIVDVFGNVPAALIEALFTIIRPTVSLNAALTHAQRHADPDFMRGFLAMDRWVNEWIPVPGAAARQWITWFYQQNRLVEGRLELCGKPVDLAAVRAPVLVVGAAADHIAPIEAVRPLVEHVGSSDKRVIVLEGGHVGIVAGRGAKNNLWPAVEGWLREHNQHVQA